MIRSTTNESIKTVTRSVVGQSLELTYGSADGLAPADVAELSEEQYLAADPLNTYTIVPSSEHNPA